ncbi:CUE domain-containing protein 1 isoform X2 [Oratosquilla oratoria]|uniref:CUE domain-containing protein 1 isoform X2 n=1 Tax=Oratosquilla oratoria TaxID=337810 RepID=UPI003F75F7BD
MAAVEGQATQLDFHQAMDDFKTMFPDMDADVIEAVLRANRGAVDATIDQLLTMSVDAESEKGRTNLSPGGGGGGGGAANELPPSYALSASPPPSYHQAVPSPSRSIRDTVDIGEGDGMPLRVIHNWNPPMLLPLPGDFLRIPTVLPQGMGVLSPHRLSQRLSENAAAREALGENDAELAQYLADERIALFLQNDEFMHELRTNSEFMRSLQRDYEEESEEGEPSPTSGGRMHLGGHIDDAALRERIANMGKASRKKFAHIAKVFSRRKRGARNLLPGVVGGPGGGRDQLLISSDPLIDDEEEDQTQKMCKPSSPRHGR